MRIRKITAAVVVCFAACAMLLTGCGSSKTVKVADYVETEFSGTDGDGEAQVYFDADSFVKDYGDKLELVSSLPSNASDTAQALYGELSMASVVSTNWADTLALAFESGYEITPSSGLKNGDKVKLTWDITNDQVKALNTCFGCKFDFADKSFTVKSLE